MKKLSNESIRLLFISDHLGLAHGMIHGASTYYLNVLPRLQSFNVNVTPCFLRGYHSIAEKLKLHGVEPLFFNRAKWDFRVMLDIAREIRKRKIQLVHLSGMKSILLGRIVAHFFGLPVIIHLHDTNNPGWIFAILNRSTSQWSDICLVVSKNVGEVARSKFGIPTHKVRVLYNGINLDPIQNVSADARKQIRRELDIPIYAKVLGIIGRLSPEKGHKIFLKVFPELLATHPESRLLIVGEGNTRSNCEKIVESLRLKDFVRFTGHRNDIPNILSAIDITVIPSTREGLSYSAIESMAAGRPVVAFDVGGVPELISNNITGLLVPYKNDKALIGAIRQLFDDMILCEKIISNASRFVQNLSIDLHTEKLVEIYRELVNQSINVKNLFR